MAWALPRTPAGTCKGQSARGQGASDDQSVDAVGAGVVAAPQLHTVGCEAAEPDGILSVVVRAAGEAVRAVGADRVAAVSGCGNLELDGGADVAEAIERQRCVAERVTAVAGALKEHGGVGETADSAVGAGR